MTMQRARRTFAASIGALLATLGSTRYGTGF
jgi:hypothetical protein